MAASTSRDFDTVDAKDERSCNSDADGRDSILMMMHMRCMQAGTDKAGRGSFAKIAQISQL